MPVDFIAEVSSNHQSNLSRCLAFVDCAGDIGCDAVKFQLFKVDELFAPEILRKSLEHRRRKEWELPVEFLPELTYQCQATGIRFGCTPFYLSAVDELFTYIDFYKISSYELLWDDLLIACANTGKPVILSTGMATLKEVKHAVEIIRNNGNGDLTLLHCVSDYPASVVTCNLSAIKTLRDEYGCKVGWSDHSVNPAVIYRAIHNWQADTVEFHLDLDGKGTEYNSGHCWLPNKIQYVIETIKRGFESDGDGSKVPVASELHEREWRADPSDGLRPLKHIRNRVFEISNEPKQVANN